MIDAEKLLGKILSGAVPSGGKKKKKKRKKSDDVLTSLVGGLASGKGLLTAIGLGVGAYEILKQQSVTSQPQSARGNVTSSPPSMPPPGTSVKVPPPISGDAGSMPPPLPAEDGADMSENEEQNIAVKLIQTMVAAAHADGMLDHKEEERILIKLQEYGLDSDEKQYVLAQLHRPKTLDQLVQGVQDPAVAQTMYSLAVSTVVVDTEQERQWLDQLAGKLSISPAMQRFIEEDL